MKKQSTKKVLALATSAAMMLTAFDIVNIS